MLKKIIFAAFAASLVFSAQELAIKIKPSPNSPSILETNLEERDESQRRIDECMQKDSSTAGMIQCVNAEFAIQDKILNENYKKAMDVLTEENRKILKDVQRKWIAYKEAKCAFYPKQGTIHRLDAADCYLQMTKERIGELGHVIEIFKGQ
ncbi:lysozyme inhibitor LprI family protein [uncultured Campylobacter sp.]|uniref:lysozyme inhibitor LprI family protein n=1 Tax=uncultured Campylobacter sp. TaxID=218934 RepID=UPI002608FA91|nr:lysozyme inhibitor LprI family protein [uncultured Campylobacter sp.]